MMFKTEQTDKFTLNKLPHHTYLPTYIYIHTWVSYALQSDNYRGCPLLRGSKCMGLGSADSIGHDLHCGGWSYVPGTHGLIDIQGLYVISFGGVIHDPQPALQFFQALWFS